METIGSVVTISYRRLRVAREAVKKAGYGADGTCMRKGEDVITTAKGSRSLTIDTRPGLLTGGSGMYKPQ